MSESGESKPPSESESESESSESFVNMLRGERGCGVGEGAAALGLARGARTGEGGGASCTHRRSMRAFARIEATPPPPALGDAGSAIWG